MKTDNEILEEFKASAKRLIEWRAAHPDVNLYANGKGLEKHEPYVNAIKDNLFMGEIADRVYITDFHFHIERVAFIPIELYKAIRSKDEAFINENFPNLYQTELNKD